MTCVLIIASLLVVLMYYLPFSFSGRLILVSLILTLGVTCSLRTYYFGFLNDFTKFTKHWHGLVDVEGSQSGLGPKTESYLHHLSLDRNEILFR